MKKTDRIPNWPMWDATHRHLETLNQYLERMHDEGHTEFRVSIQQLDPVTVPSLIARGHTGADVRFLIHPMNQDGDTADFEAAAVGDWSPGITSYEIVPLTSEGLSFEEWTAAVRERVPPSMREDDGNLNDFFHEGYRVDEMPAVLADRAEERERESNHGYDY